MPERATNVEGGAFFDTSTRVTDSWAMYAQGYAIMLLLTGVETGGEDLRVVSVEQACELALKQAPSIALSQSRLRAVRALEAVESSAFAWQLNTQALRHRGGGLDEMELSSGLARRFRWGGSLGVAYDRFQDRTGGTTSQGASVLYTQPLWGGGWSGASGALRAAGARLEAQRAQTAWSRIDTIFLTRLAYWDLAAAQDHVAILEASVRQSKALYDETKRLVDAGELPATDLKPVHLEWATSRARLIQAERGLLRAQETLAGVIGVVDPARVLRAGSEFPRTSDPRALAQEKHPQVIAARAAVRAEEAALEAAQSLARPRVDLSVRYGRLEPAGQAPATALSAGEYGTLGVSTDLPFGAPRDRALARHQAALLAQARIEAQRVARGLALAKRRAAEDLKLATTQLEVAEQALDLARQSARDELRKLRAGLSTVIATSVARERALAARLQLVDARAQLAKSAASWTHATGAPWRDQEAKP